MYGRYYTYAHTLQTKVDFEPASVGHAHTFLNHRCKKKIGGVEVEARNKFRIPFVELDL